MNEIFLNADIISGKLKLGTDSRKKYENFVKENENKNIEISLTLMDEPGYYLYKYYWGFLLPAIMKAYGEYDLYKVHVHLKCTFLYFEWDKDIFELPTRIKENGVFVCEKENLIPLHDFTFKIPFSMIKNMNILVLNNDILCGYVLSTAKKIIKINEFKEFIKSCEHRLLYDLSGNFDGKDNDVSILRDKGGL